MDSARTFRPDRALIAKYALYVLLIFVLGFLPWTLLGLIPELGWAFVLIYLAANAVWVLVALVLIPLYVQSITYTLGDEEIEVRQGIITRSRSLVPYRMITNVAVKRGPLDRLLRLGTILVHTAGYSQTQSAEATLPGLTDYDGVHGQILAELRRYRATAGGTAEPAPQPVGGSEELLAQILDELRQVRRQIGAQD